MFNWSNLIALFGHKKEVGKTRGKSYNPYGDIMKWRVLKLNFKSNKLPSTSKEIEWYWSECVKEDVDFSRVTIDDKLVDFTNPVDFFDLTDKRADKISYIGRDEGFFSQNIALTEFGLDLFGNISADTQIGVILNNVSKKREKSEAYALFATFKKIGNSVYCAFSVGLVDKDTGMEMETAVVEIGEDEEPYIQPICIPELALHFFTFDDIAMLSFWLGNFWAGIQYEMNHMPEEIRVVEQRESETYNSEEYKEGNHIVLVKKVIPIDEDGNRIKYDETISNRHFHLPAWTVRGHERTLSDGRVISVRPYKKGNHRNAPEALVKKEYRFVDKK